MAIILAVATNVSVSREGNSPFEPAPAGVQLSGIIECGRGYTTHELYDMKITLLEVIRGEDAWERLKQADSGNKPCDADSDYILAKVKFEYSSRTAPGQCVHKITPEQFTACSVEGMDFPSAESSLPKPEMRGDLKSGESLEGWVAFKVPKTEKEPLLSYSADSGGAILHGGGKWFKLY